MTLLPFAAALIIFIASILTFYTALLHLTRKTGRHSYRFRIIRDLVVGLQALQLAFVSLGWQFSQPVLLYPFLTLLFLSGTLNYIRYYRFLIPGGKIPLQVKIQLIPPALIFLGETWFYFFFPGETQVVLRSLFDQPIQHSVTLVLGIGVLYLLVQFVMLLRLELGFITSENHEIREPVIASSIIMALYMVDTLLISAGFLLAMPGLMNVGIILMGLTGITYLLFENRYPLFYQLVAREEKQKKYRKSLIQGLSKDVILARLQELMEDEKVYRQFELKLEDVASMLLITPHQLSEFINEHIGVNFATYINRYRIEEAKDLLLHDPGQSILSIAFSVGFGSKPSFNNIFKQQTGMTPSEFRKQKV